MVEPVSITIAATAAAEVAGGTVAIAAAETATVGAVAEGGAICAAAAGELAAASETLAMAEGAGLAGAGGVLGETAIGLLEVDAAAIAEGVLAHAEVGGATAAGELAGAGEGLTTTIADVEMFDPAGWVEHSATEGIVRPDAIAERFRPLQDGGNLQAYARHLEARDPSFAAEVGRRADQLRNAKVEGPADLDAALSQVRKSTSSRLSESITKEGFTPYFEAHGAQQRVEMANGSSVMDVHLTGARQPIILGRGAAVQKGGSLGIEVKAGQPAYLSRELSHLTETQIPGHLEVADTSLVVMSRDVYGVTKEGALRAAVGDAGSKILAVLPEKTTIDQVVMALVRERAALT